MAHGSCEALVGPSDGLVTLLHKFNWVFPSVPVSAALTSPGSPPGTQFLQYVSGFSNPQQGKEPFRALGHLDFVDPVLPCLLEPHRSVSISYLR